jgi:hypothetical protein
MVELYLHSPVCLHGIMFNSLSTGTTYHTEEKIKLFLCLITHHTLKTHGKWRSILTYSEMMEVSGQLHAQVALPVTHWIGGWVDRSAREENDLLVLFKTEPRFSGHLTRRCIDWWVLSRQPQARKGQCDQRNIRLLDFGSHRVVKTWSSNSLLMMQRSTSLSDDDATWKMI